MKWYTPLGPRVCAAQSVTADDYPEIEQLDDGGIFAIRLDEVIPPALRPLDEVREAVAADLFAVCARDPAGRWAIEVAEGPFAVDAAIARRCAESYDRTPLFMTLNLGAILRRLAARMLDRPAAVAAPAGAGGAQLRSAKHA